MRNRIPVFAVTIALTVVGLVSADDNVRALQPPHLTILAARHAA
jgi:hypothetical protein